MKILDFRRIEDYKGSQYAEILVREFFFFKSIKIVYKAKYGSYWRFEETGRYTPGNRIEALARKYDKENRGPRVQ